MNDFYFTEATEFPEGSFEIVARRILKTQRKLGALKGLSVSTMSLADSRKDRLKKAGLFSVAVITTSALLSAGIKVPKIKVPKKFPKFGKAKAAKEDFLDEDYLVESIKDRKARRAKQARRKARHLAKQAERLARGGGNPLPAVRTSSNLPAVIPGSNLPAVRPGSNLPAVRPGSNLPAVIPSAKNKKRSINGKLVGAGLAAAGTAGAAGYVASKKQTVVIEAKYAYGTKLFQVYNATQEEVAENVDKAILKVLTRTVASLKSAKDWAVKESVSEAFIQRAALSEMLIEETLTSQLEEDALLEEYEDYIYEEEEDEEEDDEDLAEAYYFEEDEEEEEDDEDLAEAYYFEEDEEDELVEAYIFEDDDEEEDDEEEDDDEDDEDLAEAYYFED